MCGGGEPNNSAAKLCKVNGSTERSISGRERLHVAIYKLQAVRCLNSARSFCPLALKGFARRAALAVALADALSVGKAGEHRAKAKATAKPGDWQFVSSTKLIVGLMSSKDAKRSVDGKAMELHEVEAGAFKATDPLTLPAFLKQGSSNQHLRLQAKRTA